MMNWKLHVVTIAFVALVLVNVSPAGRHGINKAIDTDDVIKEPLFLGTNEWLHNVLTPVSATLLGYANLNKGKDRTDKNKTFGELVKANELELQSNIAANHSTPEIPEGWKESDPLNTIKMDAVGLPPLEESSIERMKEEEYMLNGNKDSDRIDKTFNQNNIIFEDDDGNIINVHDDGHSHRNDIKLDDNDENVSAIFTGKRERLPSVGDMSGR